MPGLIALTAALLLHGADAAPEQILRQAESSFQQGMSEKNDLEMAKKHFAQAASQYAMLHSLGASNRDLYLCWGNAELLAGDVPQAILAYRRGLRLAPGDLELSENLHEARHLVNYPPGAEAQPAPSGGGLLPGKIAGPAYSWLCGHLRVLLFAGTAAGWMLASLALLRWLKLRRTWLPGRAVLLLLVAGTCGFFWHREEVNLERDTIQPIVVIARETSLLRGNGASYPALSSVPTLFPGMEARRLAQRGDWLQIQLPAGPVGWVPRHAVLVDEQ